MAWEMRNGRWGNHTAVVVDRPRLETLVRGLGINETARQVGCSGPTISMIINGRRQSCAVDIATKLAKVLGIDRGEVFEVTTVDQTTRPVPAEASQEKKTA